MGAYPVVPRLSDLLAPNVAIAEKILQTLDEDDRDDRLWRSQIFRKYPVRLSQRLAAHYKYRHTHQGRRDANLFLLDRLETSHQWAVPLNWSEEELMNYSKKIARQMRQAAWFYPDNEEAVRVLSERVKGMGVEPPAVDGVTITAKGMLNRLGSPEWWLRKLRVVQSRNIEVEAIQLGMVNKRSSPYISQDNLQRHKEQKQRNRRVLDSMLAINDDEQMFTLAQLAEKSVSNPVIRRNELMARLAGFEQIADELGHVAAFVTLTCPSRMHSVRSISGAPNPKYDGTTPGQAQTYLAKIWSRIRAKLKRDNIDIYGFRVAEPHHDGTPHWHLLVFLAPQHLNVLKAIFNTYALQDDANEKGANRHRVKWEMIDKSKGSAVAYVAKYVSKNIDGYAMSQDESGIASSSAAERVLAWASTWRIRQFQQFGGPPVSVWRELRRSSGDIPNGVLKDAFAAADAGKWADFLKVMGGIAANRKAMPVNLLKVDLQETGRYGDPVGPKVIGLECGTQVTQTRYFIWRVVALKDLLKLSEAASDGAGMTQRTPAVRS